MSRSTFACAWLAICLFNGGCAQEQRISEPRIVGMIAEGAPPTARKTALVIAYVQKGNFNRPDTKKYYVLLPIDAGGSPFPPFCYHGYTRISFYIRGAMNSAQERAVLSLQPTDEQFKNADNLVHSPSFLPIGIDFVMRIPSPKRGGRAPLSLMAYFPFSDSDSKAIPPRWYLDRRKPQKVPEQYAVVVLPPELRESRTEQSVEDVQDAVLAVPRFLAACMTVPVLMLLWRE